MRLSLTLLACLTGASAWGMGFSCRSTRGYVFLLEQHLEKGKRHAESFVVGHRLRGTLLTAGEKRIRRLAKDDYVEYWVDGNSKVEATRVVARIQRHDGREFLLPGESTTASLKFYGGRPRTVRLTCFRYRKS